jgi:isoleucyl-tRNA synthetase
VTHLAVLGRDGMPWPSDLVLEGGDQFRGWFRSSLITAVAIKGRAPYRRVMKNGWVNDEQGRPMSKSRGTGIDASDAMTRWGADVLRLWAASVEPIDDVRFGPNVVDQVGRVYRNLRNRMRFMLSNSGRPRGPPPTSSRAKRWSRSTGSPAPITDAFVAGVKGAYDELSRFTTPICASSSSKARCRASFSTRSRIRSTRARPERSAPPQRAVGVALHRDKRFFTTVAPVLSFTAEEAWQHLPKRFAARRPKASSTVLSTSTPGTRETESDLALMASRCATLRARVAASAQPRDFEAQVRAYGSAAALHGRCSRARR